MSFTHIKAVIAGSKRLPTYDWRLAMITLGIGLLASAFLAWRRHRAAAKA